MRNSYSTADLNLSCRRCGANELVAEPAKPPHYLAQRCAACGLFQKFISKKRNTSAQTLAPLWANSYALSLICLRKMISHRSYAKRFEKLEKEISRINLELLFYNQIFRPQCQRPGRFRIPFERKITNGRF